VEDCNSTDKMPSSRADFVTLDDDELDRIDSICHEFDSSWRDGTRLPIESFVAKVPARLRPAVLRELIHQEAELRFRAGEEPTPAEYAARFPDHADTFERVWNALTDHPDGTAANGSKRMLPLPREFGRYRVERELGRGGMGAVFLAHDTQLHRNVAIKVLFFDLSQDAAARSRFLHEARAMATLQHPNLCPIYDVGEVDGRQFLSMPYFTGKTFAARLRGEPSWSPRDAAEFIAKLAVAVQHAHEAGLIHRDLKPGNIMFDARGEPVIMDFGLARRAQSSEETLTHTGTLVGSPAYMAPEQVESKTEQIGPATDVWALGVILYQMLCGRRPFEGGTGSVLSKIVSSEPAPLTDGAPQADATIATICTKAMSKQPENRFASAGAMADALQAYLRGEATESQFARSSTNMSRLQWVAVLVAAGVLVPLLVYTMGGFRSQPTPASISADATSADNDGWISLLPSANLAGWKVLGDGKWSVHDGVVRYEGDTPSRIMNDRVFSDFELSVEYFLPEDSSSGVFLRSPRDGNPDGSDCLEVQLIDDDSQPRFASGTVFRLMAPRNAPAPQRVGDWNTLIVRTVGSKLTSSINGAIVADVELFQGKWRRNVKGQTPRTEGHIGLQGKAGSHVEFRNLRVRPVNEQ
jgi:serine/threonine protein kinase